MKVFIMNSFAGWVFMTMTRRRRPVQTNGWNSIKYFPAFMRPIIQRVCVRKYMNEMKQIEGERSSHAIGI